MKQDVKIRFSPKELRHIKDSEFLLTKKEITKKVYDLFHELSEVFKTTEEHRTFIFPPGTDHSSGKISRGENYKGLPFVILDFPRLFSGNDILAVRSIFWWGKYFMITLHLKGAPLQAYRSRILKNWKVLKKSGFYVSISEKEWEHDLNSENYKPLKKATPQDIRRIMDKNGFIKFSRKIPLKNYERLLSGGSDAYRKFLKLLS